MLFDQISKRFAARRLSRRQTLAAGAIGLAGLAAGAEATTAAPAPAAPNPGALTLLQSPTGTVTAIGTPTADEEKEVMFLFLQSFQSGSLAPKPDAPDRFILTLSQGLGETIYFSDRPAKIVGSMPTEVFLDALGFTPNNPPNAALIGHRDADHKDVVVVELFDPKYDSDTNTATYEVTLLEDWRRLGTTFEQTPDDEQHLPREFTAAHLFIDDCPDSHYICTRDSGQYEDDIGSLGVRGTCWDWVAISCYPCAGLGPTWDECNRTFPACQGKCRVQLRAA